MKTQLRELLKEWRFTAIADLTESKRRVLGILTSLTFDPEPLIAWRACEAMGVAAKRILPGFPDYVRSHLRRLHWLLSEESGGVCWYAPQAMAEILRRCPEEFPDYIRIVVSFLETMAEEDLERFRSAVLWAIARLGEFAAPEIGTVLPDITACLGHPDAQVRAMAAWCLGQIGHIASLRSRRELRSDKGEALLYRDGRLNRLSVGDITRQAIE
jgi:hypothetical protein